MQNDADPLIHCHWLGFIALQQNQRFKSSPRLNSSGKQYQLRYGTLLTRLLMQVGHRNDSQQT
ncbi:hypothetical protein T05_973 [Trichinella murrelli]|uniref:Uncharacterized protein n=1 Tax=Trichinella murrelli TaxID=144512 RepID=A0A0V0UHI3_9BILA|nr:hypothetical protein T05_973 [Trichinella murrelli]